MNRNLALTIPALLLTAAASLSAQDVLRPAPSGRATTQVTLSYPRAAGAMAAMPGMAPAPAMAAAPAPQPAATSPSPAMRPAAAQPAAAAASPATRSGAAMSATPAMAMTPAAPPLVIRLDYGQPHLRGRTLHTDGLVPYDKPWRTGANESTTLTTAVDLILGGATLAKGTYVLYTIPGQAAWKLVVQRSVGQTPMQYSDSNDVARIDLRHSLLSTPVESLTMWLIPSADPGPARGELRMAWGTHQLSTDWSIK